MRQAQANALAFLPYHDLIV